MADEILETLVTRFVADLGPLEAGFTKASRESQQAGQRIGQGLQAGIDRTNLRDDGVKLGRELSAGVEQGIRQGGAGVDRAVTGLTASLGSKSGGGLGGAFASLTTGAGGLSAGLGSIAAAAGPVAAGIGAVTASATVAIKVFNDTTNEFARFEKGLAGVSTLTDQMPGQLGQTGQAILNLSRDLGMSYGDLTSGLQDILGAGVRGTEDMTSALAFLKDAAKLAIAGQTDTAVATDALTSVLNAYKLTASDTKRISDEMFAAVRDGKLSFNELASGIGAVTAIAADSQVPIETLLAAVATMTANGVQASQSMDYLRSLIAAIINPSSEAATAAKHLGIEFNAQALASKGLVGVLQDVMRATHGDKQALGDLLGGVEAMTAATSIASGNFDRMTTNLKNQATAAGTTEAAYAKMAGTLSKQNDKVQADWSALMVNLGAAFAPFKTEVLSGISVMLDGLNKVLEKFNLARNVRDTDAAIAKEQATISNNAKDRAELVKLQGPAQGTVVYERLQARIDALDASTKAAQVRLTQLQADAAQARADQTAYNVANSTAVLPKGVQGPNMGKGSGAPVDMASIPAESGKFGYAFISKLADVFVNDPQVASDCAIIASRILKTLGVQIDASANAGTLEKNAKKAGFTQVEGDEIKPGDLIVWTSGNGKTYGVTSGKHVGVAAGFQNGKLMVIENPGSSNTQVVPMYDRQNAQAYRAPTSPFAAGAPVGADGSGGASKDDLKSYSLNLADWNKNQARALELAREAAKAESDLTGRRGLQVKAAMEAWAGEDKARQQSYQLAVQLTARQEQAARKAKSDADQEARKDDARRKEAEQAAARLNEALRQGKIEAARTELTRLQEMRENDLRKAGDNAQKVAAVERRYAQLTYDAKAAIALREQQDRDAGIRNDKSLNSAARQQELTNSNQKYLNALSAAANERAAVQDRIDKQATDKARTAATATVQLNKAATDAVTAELTRRQEELDAGVEAGNAALETLSGMNLGGRDMAAAVNPAAADTTETFNALFDRITALRGELQDTGTAEAWIESLEEMARQGGLTARQLQTLVDVIGDLSAPGGALLPDNLQGRGVTNEPGVDDPAFGVLTDQERQTLITQMDALNLDQIGEIYAGLVLKGLENSDLGKLIADYLQGQADVTTQSLLDNGGMTFDADGRPVFQSDADVRGSTTPGDGEDTPFDLSSVDVSLYGTLEALDQLIEKAGLGEDAAQTLREAWQAQNEALQSVIKGYDEAGNAIYYTDVELRELGATTGDTSEDFFDLGEAIKNVGTFSRGELERLIVTAGLTEDQAAALRKEWERLAKVKLDDVQKQLMDTATQIAGAVTQVGALFDKLSGSEAKGALSILGDWMTMNVTALKQFQSGDVVGAVMTSLNGVLNIGESIAELNSGLREWKKNLREIAEEQKKVLGMSTGGFKSPWEDALKADAGSREQLANSKWYQRLWWGLTGGGPQAISDEAAKLLTELQGIFAQLGEGISDAFTDAMLSAFESGDMSNFAENFSKQFDQIVGKVILKTMIDAAITQGAVAGDLADLTKAIQEQRFGDVPAILTRVKTHAGQVAGQIGAVLPSLPGFGAGAGGSGSDGMDNRALFGNAPTAQLGIPRFEVTLPDSFTKPLSDFAGVIPAFSRATDRLYEAADMIVRAHGGLNKPTGLAPM